MCNEFHLQHLLQLCVANHRIPPLFCSPAVQSSLKITSALKISGSCSQANTMQHLRPYTTISLSQYSLALHTQHNLQLVLQLTQVNRRVYHTQPKHKDSSSCQCKGEVGDGQHSRGMLKNRYCSHVVSFGPSSHRLWSISPLN